VELFPVPRSNGEDPWLKALIDDPGAAKRVSWGSPDSNPDYYMLPIWLGAKLEDTSFVFTIETLKLLMDRARFPTQLEGGNKLGDGRLMVFTLRGCVLESGGDKASGKTLRLRAVMPDHLNYNCLVGVAELETGRLDVFSASSVANATALFAQARAGLDYNIANYLPSGRFRYTVNAHGDYPGHGEHFAAALKMSNAQGDAAQVVVVRPSPLTSDPVRIDGAGRWSLGRPGDNIHPAMTPKRKPWDRFSSEGCTVIRSVEIPPDPASPKAGLKAGGLWADFADRLGVSTKVMGQSVLGVTFMGHEAMLATQNKVRPTLRPGSVGPEVERLGQLLASYGEAEGWQNTVPEGGANLNGPAAQLRVFVNNWLDPASRSTADKLERQDVFGPRLILAWLMFQSDYRRAFDRSLARRTLSTTVTRTGLQLADSLGGSAQTAREKTKLQFFDQLTAS
jgi:hypothetical protein